MQIHRLTAFQVHIALRKPVRHASHERFSNDTIILRCVMDDGSVGWGEGLPRSYVTGESIDSVWRHLQESSFSELRETTLSGALEAALSIDRFSLAEVCAESGIVVRECFGNAVRCAIELAILDAACRSEGISMGDLARRLPDAVSFAAPVDEVFYTRAGLGIGGEGYFQQPARCRGHGGFA